MLDTRVKQYKKKMQNAVLGKLLCGTFLRFYISRHYGGWVHATLKNNLLKYAKNRLKTAKNRLKTAENR